MTIAAFNEIEHNFFFNFKNSPLSILLTFYYAEIYEISDHTSFCHKKVNGNDSPSPSDNFEVCTTTLQHWSKLKYISEVICSLYMFKTLYLYRHLNAWIETKNLEQLRAHWYMNNTFYHKMNDINVTNKEKLIFWITNETSEREYLSRWHYGDIYLPVLSLSANKNFSCDKKSRPVLL